MTHPIIDREDLNRRLGGAIGAHAQRRGIWFDPVTWTFLSATAIWVIALIRQLPCRPVEGSPFPNAYLRTCYSDIPTLFFTRNIFDGNPVYTGQGLEYPPIIALWIEAMRWLTHLSGGVIGIDISFDEKLASSQIFFQWNAVGFFICLLILLAVHLAMNGVHLKRSRGHDSTFTSPRRWDGLMIAACPMVALSGLINWDLLAVMMTSLALWAWSRTRPIYAGIAIGCAIATKVYPLVVVVAIIVLAIRTSQWRQTALFSISGILTWLAINLPVAFLWHDSWIRIWTDTAMRGADLGSIWYVLSLAGLRIPGVWLVSYICMLAASIAIVTVALSAPRRPRLAQLVALFLIAFLTCATVYSPQYSLWLVPVIALAYPRWKAVALWWCAEIFYFFAIWGFLEGIIGVNSGSGWIYWVAVFTRIIAQIWIALAIVEQILAPWTDEVRSGYVDDPIGGPFDHSSDAQWLAEALTMRANTA